MSAEERLAVLISEIEKIHRPIDGGEHGPDECWEDVERWPCRTYDAVQRAKTQ